jgi:hypothetical protein
MKEQENGTAVGEMLSASRQLRNELRHESIFEDVAISEQAGLMKDVSFPEVNRITASSWLSDIFCVAMTAGLI